MIEIALSLEAVTTLLLRIISIMMPEVDWNLTVCYIYPNGFREDIKLFSPYDYLYGRKLGNKRPIAMSIPETHSDKLVKNCHYVLDPRVSRGASIITHTTDGPDMDRINKIVFTNDKQLY